MVEKVYVQAGNLLVLPSTQWILQNYLSNLCSSPGRVRTIQLPSTV